MGDTSSAFKTVFASTPLNDGLYAFLQVVYHLYPEDQFHYLLAIAAKDKNTDEEIYKEAQKKLPAIKPFLADITYSLPALLKQKKEIRQQTLRLLGNRKGINGYLEIGSTGRYLSSLKKKIKIKGNVFVMNDIAPTNAVADIFERGGITKAGRFLPLTYQPISSSDIEAESLDVVTCYIGLHHCPHHLLKGFIQSIHRVLRKGGLFIMRDHDVKTPQMHIFVSLVHTVFNLGLNVPWQVEAEEFKSLRPISEWSEIVSAEGFSDTGERILQDKDPSLNTLLSFIKL
jgi:SAM-dependent methyltransferase